MKNKIIIIILTLGVLNSFQYLTARNFTLLVDPAIGWIDGIRGALDADTLRDFLDVRRIINTFFHGEKNPETGLFEKKYSLEGYSENVTLNDLVNLEIKYTKEGIDHSDIRWKHLDDSLMRMKNDFLMITKPLFESASETISINMRIVKEWIGKTKRPDSHLLLWGTPNEIEALMVLDVRHTKMFLLDLQNFMKDLMFSAPKARKAYADEYLKTEEKKQGFEALFKTH